MINNKHMTNKIIPVITALCATAAAAYGQTAGLQKGGSPVTAAGARIAAPGHSPGSRSNVQMRLGEQNPLVPPFCETFDNLRPGMEHEDFRRYFQTIDANNDERSWGLYNYAEAEPYGRCAYLLYPVDVNQADDWLIPRAIKLEAGKYYCVHVDAALYQDGEPHAFEIKYGLFNDPEGLDQTVIPRTEVSTTHFNRAEGWICPDFDGKYYIGIHAISLTQYGYLFIDNISIDAPLDAGAPAGVSDLVMTNSPDGKPEVALSFLSPLKSLDGSSLTGKMSIVIKRDGKTVTTLSDIEPGKSCSFTDKAGKEGDYVYTIVASNDCGDGATVRREHHVGLVAPLPPEIETFADNGDGYLSLSWKAPETDVNGNKINSDIITYSIYNVNEYGDPVAESTGLSANSTLIPLPSSDDQKMEMRLVTATVGGRESDFAPTDMLVVGKPYALPFECSFTTDDYYKYVFEVSGDKDVVWRMVDDFSDPKSQDGDNGYISMIGTMPGQESSLVTGKLDFTTATAPYISFYTYVYKDDDNEITISATDVESGESTVVGKYSLSDFTRVGWNLISCPLDAFAGCTVRIAIKGHIETHGYIPVDNLTVSQRNNLDAAVGNVTAPRFAHAGETFDIVAEVFNKGTDDIHGCEVILEKDETPVETQKCDISRGETIDVRFSETFTSLSDPMSSYCVRVILDGDGDSSDNTSAPFTVTFIAPVFPAVKDLSISETVGMAMLSWSAPDLTAAPPMEVMEDFESYAPFAVSFGGWTTIDADGGYTGGFQDLEMPGIDLTPQSWWVMPSDAPYSFITPHSGTRCLAQMYAINGQGNGTVPCDDWLITPRLYGGAQTIGFAVRSFSTDYGYDTYETYYSISGNTRDCFEPLTEQTETTGDWEEQMIAVPDGTRYFAIRCTSDNIYMMMADDFTFIPEGTPRELTLIGYNMYRNGEKINVNPIDYTECAVPYDKRTDTFFVTAVYDAGESVASNAVALQASVKPVIGTGDSSTVEYYDLMGVRHHPDHLAPGIYIRRSGQKADKIIIR